MPLFPTSPTNGQYTTVNTITYVYDSTTRSWTRVPGTGGGGGTPGGQDQQVQYNAAGAFAGSSALTFNYNTNALVATGNITGGNLLTSGTISAASHIGSVVSVSGNITGGNINTGAQVVATGNITGGNLLTSGIVSASSYIGSVVSVTGNITGAGHVGTIYTNSIINTGANSTGNIGSSTLYFNTVFAKATSAQYADVAEIYVADSNYTPGTVLDFGGVNEVTITTTSYSQRIAGVVSTNPAYIMNSGQTGQYTVQLALLGRVPCRVKGQINKGDKLVSSDTPGVAQACVNAYYEPGTVIGKALQTWDSESEGVIEVVVGRM